MDVGVCVGVQVRERVGVRMRAVRPWRNRRVAAALSLALLTACGPTTPLDGVAPPRAVESVRPADPAPSPAVPARAPDPAPVPDPASDATPDPAPDPVPTADPAPDPTTVGELVVHVLDVGQGSALLLQHPEVTVLVDTGRHDRSDVVPALRSRGVTAIDLLVVTHPHADHVGQFDDVIGAFPVAEVWWNGSVATSRTFERAVAALEASGARYEEPRAPATTTVGPLVVDVVNPWPGADLGELNDASLALRFTFGSIAVLVTGDAEAGAERRMVSGAADLLRADVLIVGHHGSRTSTTPRFLATVDPAVAVWSAGAGNSYGHPHPEVLAALAAHGARVLGTAVDGAVTITTDGTDLDVRSGR